MLKKGQFFEEMTETRGATVNMYCTSVVTTSLKVPSICQLFHDWLCVNAQSCLTLSDLTPQGCSVHGIPQARIL